MRLQEENQEAERLVAAAVLLRFKEEEEAGEAVMALREELELLLLKLLASPPAFARRGVEVDFGATLAAREGDAFAFAFLADESTLSDVLRF